MLPPVQSRGAIPLMRLADFIKREMEAILSQWEAFAATLLPAAKGMESLALRDHAQQILEAIVQDLSRPQTREQQWKKSHGRSAMIDGASETAAQTHAVLRARGGFDINQLVAEYRALRASVLRLWMDSAPLDSTGAHDMIRFDEAIDQAIAESVGHFHQTVERYRNLLLGMLGHDMRNPLNAIIITAHYLAQLNAGEEISDAADRLIHCGASMQGLLDDLTDFNRTKLGLGINIHPAQVDLASAAEAELEQFRVAYPSRQFKLNVSGETTGQWDGKRVQQILRNLVANAIKYGEPKLPVRIGIRGDQGKIELIVSNSGHLDATEAQRLFDPLRRGTSGHAPREASEGLGLGLFIVREIARAHGGEVEARCEEDRTNFIVRLPRQDACVAANSLKS